MRRAPLLLPFLLVAVAVFLPAARWTRADDLRDTGLQLVDEATRDAISRGTEYLLSIQSPDGSWPSDAGKKVNDGYHRFQPEDQHRSIPHVGVTSLSVLALLAGGHLPGRGRTGEALDRAIRWISAQVETDGFIAAHGTRMYSHAFATLALAEAYGVTRDARLRRKLQDAVEFTVKSQNATGGWRYAPLTNDSDMSVTVCQVVALRAAQNVGIRVPTSTIERSLLYVLRSAIIEDGTPTGAFYYQPDDPERANRDSFALCAAALTTIFQAGIYDDDALRAYGAAHGIAADAVPSIQRSVAYMDQEYRMIARRFPTHYYFYYGNYYAAQALYQVGAAQPALWAKWYRRVRNDLLTHQVRAVDSRTGREVTWWTSLVDSTNAYATASALLILQFPLDHLPIHQR